MIVKIFGTNDEARDLLNRVNLSLEELGLNDFVSVEETNDEDIKTQLNITKEPALIIEEESIDFKDMIFEGIVPESDELKSMFVSIIGGGESSSCGTGEGCGTGCSC